MVLVGKIPHLASSFKKYCALGPAVNYDFIYGEI